MNIVDSSGWLEFFADGPNAGAFAPVIQKTEELAVPAISLYEVFKKVLQERGESEALVAAALMQQGAVIDLDATLAISAAKIAVDAKLPMADAIMLATARALGATLWTQDADFAEIHGVRYVPPR
jgi:predicted nucleic acid-binding protein